jgi:hypothetical protein
LTSTETSMVVIEGRNNVCYLTSASDDITL